MALPPPPPSSAGWKITIAVPAKLRVSARYCAAPSSIAVWPSWPQACILPGTVDLYGTSPASWIGSASMSARSPMTRPPAPPLVTADHAHHARAPDPGHHLVAAKALELVGNGGRRAL